MHLQPHWPAQQALAEELPERVCEIESHWRESERCAHRRDARQRDALGAIERTKANKYTGNERENRKEKNNIRKSGSYISEKVGAEIIRGVLLELTLEITSLKIVGF